jgi:hypothetical protein
MDVRSLALMLPIHHREFFNNGIVTLYRLDQFSAIFDCPYSA